MRLLAATVAAIAIALAWYFALRSRSRGFPRASDGVFFRQFPGTGSFANRRLSAAELRRRVAAWRTPYTPGPLTPEQHAQFFDDGFVIVRDLAPEAELRGAIDAVDGLVDTIARRLHAAGKVSSLHTDAGFHRRLIELEKEFPRAGVLLHKAGVCPRAYRTCGRTRHSSAPRSSSSARTPTSRATRCGICAARRRMPSASTRRRCRGTRTPPTLTRSAGTRCR